MRIRVGVAVVAALVSFLASVCPALDQAASSNSDPKAVTLLSAAYAALTGGTPVTDMRLSGSAAWVAGSTHDSGSALLEVLGTGESRVQLQFSTHPLTEVRSNTSGIPAGQWIGADGVTHAMASHNCEVPASWFSPSGVVAALVSIPNTVLSYQGRETLSSGAIVDHVQAFQYPGGKAKATSINLMKRLSTVDLYLDASSHLPIVLRFNTHPDDDVGTDIPVEIQYSAFRTVNGVAVAFQVAKLLNGTPTLTIALTNVAINSGLSDSTFSLN